MPYGQTVMASASPTVDTAAYAAKDLIGADELVFTFSESANNGGVIHSAVLIDRAQQLAEIDLVLFRAALAATLTNNSAFDPTDADLANLVGVITFEATDYADFNDNAAAVKAGIGLSFSGGDRKLYGVLVSRGTPDYVAATDITVILTAMLD